jgi:hypothetical protein
MIIFLSFAFFSCNKEKIVGSQSQTFTNNDWNWSEKDIYFHLNIDENKDPYKVVFDIHHDKGIDFSQLSFVMIITAPDGAETAKNIIPQYDKILDETGTISTVVAYPEKYFNQKGEYTFWIYRRYEKYNFFGISSVELKILTIPKTE